MFVKYPSRPENGQQMRSANFIVSTALTKSFGSRGLGDAVDDMQSMIEDNGSLVRESRVNATSQYAFMAASVVLGAIGGPMTALGVGGAFVSVGQFVSGRLQPG